MVFDPHEMILMFNESHDVTQMVIAIHILLEGIAMIRLYLLRLPQGLQFVQSLVALVILLYDLFMQFLRKHMQLLKNLLGIDTHTPLIFSNITMNCSLLLEPEQGILKLSVEQKLQHFQLTLLELLHQHKIIGLLYGLSWLDHAIILLM